MEKHGPEIRTAATAGRFKARFHSIDGARVCCTFIKTFVWDEESQSSCLTYNVALTNYVNKQDKH